MNSSSNADLPICLHPGRLLYKVEHVPFCAYTVATAGASSRGTIEGLQALARRGRALLADKILCSDLQGQIAAPSMLSAMLTTTIAFHSSQGVEDSNSYAAEQLSVYGLDFNVLRKAAQEALDARDAAAAATAGGDEKILMQAKLAQKLVAVGQALTAVPVRAACNNPRCSRLSGPTELSNLNAKCSACRVAYYCCASCQRSHWKQHKPVCKAIAEAAAAAAASAGSDVANI